MKSIAADLGFDDCRIATAKRATHADRFDEWLADGQNGSMAWLEKNPARRCDPREVLEGCRSVICLAINYFPGNDPFSSEHPKNYRIAKYAWNFDYHDIIEKRLAEFNQKLVEIGGRQRYYVDTGPVLERDFATDSGLGWNGKSTVQIHRKLGTWYFLADILTTLELEEDSEFGDHCGKCTRCIDACPTQAITAPHKLDARRCISYLTIENRGAIPVEFRRAIGDRIYGCDECLEVCPWNRFAKKSQELRFHAREKIFTNQLRDFLEMDVEEFRVTFAKSPIKRIKRDRFLRNVCVALGNTGAKADLPALQKAVEQEAALVAEHAQWAIDEIQLRHSRPEG
ncbi:MAG: tRNA epoxyqueuosine(34) reductase QueG [Akkermansiaceae bacterium]